MPKRVEYPEHWEEESEQPEWMQTDEDLEEEDMVYEEEPEKWILGDEKVPDEYIDPMDEKLRVAQEELAYRQARAEKKKQIREAKRSVRRLKYSPVYQAGGGLVGGIEAAVDKMKAMRGTPEERAIKKAKFQQFMRSLSEKSTGSLNKLGGFGGGQAPSQPSDKPGLSSDLFGMGSGRGAGGNLLSSDAPNILKGSGGSLLGSSNLLGSDTPGIMKADLLGSTKRKVRRVKTKKKTKKKGKKKTGKRKGSKKGSKKTVKEPELRLI